MGELLAFSAEQASRLTGLSVQQIYRLDGAGVLMPTYADENRRRPFGRIYSFRDIVALRTIAVLRKELRIPLHELRAFGKWLGQNVDVPWSSLRFSVADRRLFFHDPKADALSASEPINQAATFISMDEIARDMHERAEQLRQRDESEFGRIERRRTVAQDSYVVAGTRIPTAAVYDFHLAGYDAKAIIREYPRLTPSDVEAAIAHEEAARHLKAS